MYTSGLLHPSRTVLKAAEIPTDAETDWVVGNVEAQTQDSGKEVMLLQRWNGKLLAEAFKLPEMEVEIERAVEQVEKAIKKDDEQMKAEKKEIEAGSKSSSENTTETKR